MRAIVMALAVVALVSTGAPSAAWADACSDCKDQCDKETEQCKKAGGRLCKGKNNPICEMYKNFQCPLAGRVCRSVRCGLLPNCGPSGDSLSGSIGGAGQQSGDPHFYSLDRCAFDYQGAGEYLLARSKEADVEIQSRLAAGGPRVSFGTMLAVRTAGHVVVFEPKQQVTVDGVGVDAGGFGYSLGETGGLIGRDEGDWSLVAGDTSITVRIHASYLDVYVNPGPASRGTWAGLLGNFDGDAKNDFITRDGKTIPFRELSGARIYGEFADGWRLSQAESFLRYAAGETTETHTDRDHPSSHPTIADLDANTFARARKACLSRGVARGDALRFCIYDVGITGSDEYAEGYAHGHALQAAANVLDPAGKLGMHVQTEGYQGEKVPVYWWGDPAVQHALVVTAADGKEVARASFERDYPVSLGMPAEVGSYTLTLSQGDASVQSTIEVTAATATLEAPATVAGATDFEVSWTGPLGQGDYIALARSGETDVNKILAHVYANQPRKPTFQAPATAGTYELWYVLQGSNARTPIARTTFTVTEATASVTPPTSVEAGAPFEVAWTGPDGGGDYVDLTARGETHPSRQVSYAYTERGTPAALRAPVQPGPYTVRYVADTSVGRAVLATAAIDVKDVKATVKAQAEVAPSAEMTITWTGPNRPGDYIAIVRAGETNVSAVSIYRWANQEDATWKAPAEAGAYEAVYVLEGSGPRRILARSKFAVKKQ